MEKNKLYIFITIIIVVLIFCSAFECITDNQLNNLFKKYPAIFNIAAVVVMIHIMGTENVNEKSEKAVLNFLEKPLEPYSKNFSVVGTSNKFKTIESLTIEDSEASNIVSFSEIQDVIKNSIVALEESNASETTATETQATKKGSITLTGSIEAQFSLSPLTLTINLDTGVVTGSFTGSYYYEGFDAGEFGKWEPDTANGVANIGGNVNLTTGKITGKGAIVYTWASGGEGETWPFTVKGDLSPDYKYASGNFVFDEGEWPWEASAE